VEHLKRIYAQLRDLYLSMTPGNRIVAVLLFSTLLVSLGYLLIGSIKPGDSRSKEVALYNGRHFTQEEQRAVEDALAVANLRVHHWVGDQLMVPKAQRATYAATIYEAKAINTRGNARNEAVLALTPWSSAKMMDKQEVNAIAQDIADEIMRMEGVASASVIPSLRKDWDRNIWAKKEVFSVSVFVETISFKPLEDNTISAIGAAVQGVFRNADLKEIKIIDSRNSRSYNGAGEELTGGPGDYLRQMNRYQTAFKDKIYNLLPHIEGLQVETSVDLTKHLSERLFTVEHGKPTKLTEHILGLDYEKIGYDRFGRPGSIAQFSSPLIDPQANQAGGAKTTEKKHEQEYSNALQGQEANTEIVPFTPERVLATLRIPDKHALETWYQENRKRGELPPEPTEEELEAVRERIRQSTQRSVAQILMPWWNARLNPEPLSMVTVEFYHPKEEPVIVLTMWQQIQLWLKQNWQSLSLMGLVLCGLCVLWSITKPPKPEPIVIVEGTETPLEVIEARLRAELEAKAAAEAEAAAEAAEAEEEEINRTLDSFGSIRSLKDEIAELIAENPDAAAAIIRQWIGNAVLVENKIDN
jgi:flagellar M-ring protein FliF